MKPVLKHGEHTMHMGHAVPPKTAAALIGHDRHAGHPVAMFRDKFWLTLFLTLLVVAWPGGGQNWLGYTAPTFPGPQLVPALLAPFFFLFGESGYICGGWGKL